MHVIDKIDVPAEIFRACDIRGVVGETLTPEIAYMLGRGFATLAASFNQSQVVVGRDGRHSGPELSKALCAGLLAGGMDVIDVGQVPTPVVYYATYAFQTGTGIMITGSHNPVNYNGFKMMLAGNTLAEGEIQQIYQCILTGDFAKGAGLYQQYDIIDNYVEAIIKDVQLARPLKIVADCGNGVVGVLAEKLFKALKCEVIPLYCEVDGDFPNHHPDPGQPANLQDLITTVKKTGADIGIAFDGDGDRLGVVTNQGEIIWPDRVMMLFVKEVLQQHAGRHIIYDVKCSKLLTALIEQQGGVPLMYKTGHSLIKQKMRETHAIMAGEMSGHFFFNDSWYGFDDGCYAAARLLRIVSKQNQTTASLLGDLPNAVSTPEINVAISEDQKFGFIEALKKAFPKENAQFITVDGLRVEYPEGWGLVRASNTTPCLVLRFEAETDAALAQIKAQYKTVMLSVMPTLEVGF